MKKKLSALLTISLLLAASPVDAASGHEQSCQNPTSQNNTEDFTKIFQKRLRSRVAGLVESRIFQTQEFQKCFEGENSPLCQQRIEDTLALIPSLWKEMRMNLVLSRSDLSALAFNETPYGLKRPLLSHKLADFASMPGLNDEERDKIIQKWKTEVRDKLPFSMENTLYIKNRVALSSPSTNLRKNSELRYFEILGSMPLLGYITSENPSHQEIATGLKKINRYLQKFLTEVNNPEQINLILSFNGLTEELLREHPEYCHSAEILTIKSEEDEAFKNHILLGAAIVSAVPCFVSGPLGLGICLTAGVGLGLYTHQNALEQIALSRGRALTGREYEQLSQLDEHEKELFWERLFLPLAFWGTTAVPLKAAGELLLPPLTKAGKAETLLSTKITPKQKRALKQSHLVGRGERGMSPDTPAGVGNYTKTQLKKKAAILKSAGFDKDQRRILVEKKIVGDEPKRPILRLNKKRTFRVKKGRIIGNGQKWPRLRLNKKRIPTVEEGGIVEDGSKQPILRLNKQQTSPPVEEGSIVEDGPKQPLLHFNKQQTSPVGEDIAVNTPLQNATNDGNINAMRLHLDKGADPDIPNKDGWTPLLSATSNGNIDAMHLLLNKGANPDIPNKDGWTPLNSSARNGHTDAIRLLLDKGADPDIPNKDGNVPLKSAVNNGNIDAIRLLLNKGADPDIPNNDGWTSLNSAADNGNINTIRLLLDKGANPDLPSKDGWTPLNSAASNGHADAVRLLLNKGANFEIPNRYDETPLFTAAFKGQKNIVGLLLQKGANVNFHNHRGLNPYTAAALNGHKDIARLLQTKDTFDNLQQLRHEQNNRPRRFNRKGERRRPRRR